MATPIKAVSILTGTLLTILYVKPKKTSVSRAAFFLKKMRKNAEIMRRSRDFVPS